MRLWIEVTNDDGAWTRKFASNPDIRQGLRAPAMTKYIDLFKPVRNNDFILTHLTSRSKNKKWRRSIIGISVVCGEQYIRNDDINIDLSNSIEFPVPIKFSEYKYNMVLSKQFQWKIKICFQRYLIDITPNDFLVLLGIHAENMVRLENTVYEPIIKSMFKCDGELIK